MLTTSVVGFGLVLLVLIAMLGVAGLAPGVPEARVEPQRCNAHAGLPDRVCTPGVRDRDVRQKNIAKTICRKGYAASVRPPASYTKELKAEQLREYDYYAGNKLSSYEEDHLISLELGGSPRDPRNLWPEAYKPKPGARQKDTVENYLHRQVCDGDMKLATAQRREARNWRKVYKQIH